jgi:hypothetical protein
MQVHMTSARPPDEEHRPEPEIILPGEIPPGRPDEQPGPRYRVYSARIGPFGVFLIACAFAILTSLVVLVLLGALVFWFVLVAGLVVAAVISRLLRKYFRRRAR